LRCFEYIISFFPTKKVIPTENFRVVGTQKVMEHVVSFPAGWTLEGPFPTKFTNTLENQHEPEDHPELKRNVIFSPPFLNSKCEYFPGCLMGIRFIMIPT